MTIDILCMWRYEFVKKRVCTRNRYLVLNSYLIVYLVMSGYLVYLCNIAKLLFFLRGGIVCLLNV